MKEKISNLILAAAIVLIFVSFGAFVGLIIAFGPSPLAILALASVVALSAIYLVVTRDGSNDGL